MSMKYYAVTDDPNELLHYGVKGMKWGQHIFGDKPKSAGYHKARAKLSKLRSSTKKAVKTVKSVKRFIKESGQQRAMNREKKQQEKYNQAVEKAQQRVNVIAGLDQLNKTMAYEKHIKNDYTASRNASRLSLRQERKYAKNEKKMDKYTQLAREGRLKYGKLSDDQVNRITDRLAIEAQTRRLGSTENPKFRLRAKEALQEGMLQGITQGTAAGMKEVAVAKVQNRLRNKYTLDKQNRIDAERQKEAARIKSRKSHKEMKQDIRDKTYEEGLEYGANIFGRTAITAKGAARKRNDIEAKRLEIERQRKLEAKINDEMDLGKNERYQAFLTKQRENKRLQDVQDRLNSKRDEDFGNYLYEKGYGNEDDAVDAHRNKLYQAISDASKSYGRTSKEFNAAVDAVNRFNSSDRSAQKRMINASAAKEKEAKEEARKAKEEEKRKQEKLEDVKLRSAQEVFKAKMKTYGEQMASYEKRISSAENAITQYKANVDRAKNPKEYDSHMRKLKKTLSDLKNDIPEEPNFEDFFRS